MKTIALFNNKGGVGKTTLVYHLAHMLPRLGYPALAVDLDPQANLTSAFFQEWELEALWDEPTGTVLACVNPILEGAGDVQEPAPITIRRGPFRHGRRSGDLPFRRQTRGELAKGLQQ